jgi:hypothetical protein
MTAKIATETLYCNCKSKGVNTIFSTVVEYLCAVSNLCETKLVIYTQNILTNGKMDQPRIDLYPAANVMF